MRTLHVSIAFLATCLGARVHAQAPSDVLTVRRLPGNITLLLPSSWVPLSDTARVRIRRVTDTALEHSHDTLLQASLQNGKPMELLHETAPGQPDPSASFNAAASPGTTRGAWDAATPEQITAALASLCGSVADMMGRLGARVITCDPPRIDREAGGTIAITRLVRSGPNKGVVTVWIAQFPANDVIYTLTLSAPQAQEERYQRLFQAIWRSVNIPKP